MVFVTRNEEINGLLFVVDVTSDGKLGKNKKKKEKKYARLWLMWLVENERKKKWDMRRMGWAMKKWINEKGTEMMELLI